MNAHLTGPSNAMPSQFCGPSPTKETRAESSASPPMASWRADQAKERRAGGREGECRLIDQISREGNIRRRALPNVVQLEAPLVALVPGFLVLSNGHRTGRAQGSPVRSVSRSSRRRGRPPRSSHCSAARLRAPLPHGAGAMTSPISDQGACRWHRDRHCARTPSRSSVPLRSDWK